jgi:hypothetical protein
MIARLSGQNAAVTRRCLRALWVLCAWLAMGQATRAETVVELRETRGLRPGLCTALRIQLTDMGEVRCTQKTDGAALPERIARAAEAVRAGAAHMAVLLERDADPDLVRMYVVGGHADRAVLAFERVENRPDPDVDRSLALKVRAALEAVRIVRDARAEQTDGALAGALVPSPAATNAARPGAPPAASTRSYAGALEVGGGPSFGQHTRALGHGALVMSARAGAYRFEGGALARWFSSLDARGPRGNVDENEWALGLGLRALRGLGSRLWLGVALDPACSVVSARGTTHSGARGQARLARFTLTVSLDLRLKLLASTFLRVAPGVDLAPVRQRFAVDGDVTLELSRARLVLPLAVWVGWP